MAISKVMSLQHRYDIRMPTGLAITYEVIVPQCGDVKEMQNVSIVETLQFLARKGLALPGDNGDDDSNFIQTLKLRAKDIPQLTD